MNKDKIIKKLINRETIFVDTLWLFRNFLSDNFNNAHFMIRYLAIDNYYKKNEFGWTYYNEMQRERVANNNMVPKEMADNQKNFELLIQSFERNGFLFDNPILVNNKIMLLDGAHRLTLALYFNIKQVPIKLDEKHHDFITKDYSFEWFKKNHMGYMIPKAMEIYRKIVEED